jgi:hypothetical protein
LSPSAAARGAPSSPVPRTNARRRRGCRSAVERLAARRAPRETDYEVGCIMISQPVFFPRDDWVADHAD